jgi:hypothetical protein
MLSCSFIFMFVTLDGKLYCKKRFQPHIDQHWGLCWIYCFLLLWRYVYFASCALCLFYRDYSIVNWNSKAPHVSCLPWCNHFISVALIYVFQTMTAVNYWCVLSTNIGVFLDCQVLLKSHKQNNFTASSTGRNFLTFKEHEDSLSF